MDVISWLGDDIISDKDADDINTQTARLRAAQVNAR